MSEKSQFVLMARYNELMNSRLLAASAELSVEELSADRGAFFKSVLGSINHIVVGDLLWLKRFAAHPAKYPALQILLELPKPSSLTEIIYDDLAELTKQRTYFDRIIIDWCNELKEEEFDTPLSYIDTKGIGHNKRLGDLILHFFLHQIHHRGQITTLLSQQGVDFGDTDLPEIVPIM